MEVIAGAKNSTIVDGIFRETFNSHMCDRLFLEDFELSCYLRVIYHFVIWLELSANMRIIMINQVRYVFFGKVKEIEALCK